MLCDQEDVDHILNTVMQGKPLTEIQKQFMLEDFKEGGKLIVNETHLFEITKIENDGTILMKPIGTSLLARDITNISKGTMTRRFIQNDEIVEKSI